MSYTIEEQAEIEHLFREMNQLIEQRAALLEKWGNIQARKWLYNNSYSTRDDPDNGYYFIPERERTELSQERQQKWNDSFFFTHTDMCDELSHFAMTETKQTQLKKDQPYDLPFIPHVDYLYRRFLVSCEGIIPYENGFRLMLADPYGCLVTSLITDMEIEDAEKWMEQIISVEIGFRFNSNEHPIRNAYRVGEKKDNGTK